MHYRSTRGFGPVSFKRTLIEAVAPDGGLYVPVKYPRFTYQELEQFSFMTFEEVMEAVLSRLIGDVVKPYVLKSLIEEVFKTWEDPEVTPLQQYNSDTWLLELFHGPSWSYKDIPLQIMAKLLPHVLDKKITFVMSTTGDLGAAAVAAFKNVENVRLVVLYPKHTTGHVHRAQLTTSGAENIFPIAVDGSYETCQKMVKAVMEDDALRQHKGIMPVSSWMRIAAQSAYFFFAWSRIRDLFPGTAVQFSVPTGEFTNAFSCYFAAECGLPVDKIIVANNQNNTLADWIKNNQYQQKKIVQTLSPCLDANSARTLERLLYDLCGKNAVETRQIMQVLQTQKCLPTLNPSAFAELQALFAGESVSETETLMALSEAEATHGLVLDPHTGVALAAAKRHAGKPTVVLSTASAVKFGMVVKQATAKELLMDDDVDDLLKAEQKEFCLPGCEEDIKTFVRENI